MRYISIVFFLFAFGCNNTSSSIKLADIDTTSIVPKPQPQKKYITLSKLLRKSPEEIKHELGKPTKLIPNPKDCPGNDPCQLEAHYRGGSITILYKKNKAVWFEFDNLHEYTSTNPLSIFGLSDDYNPSVIGKGYIWYKSVPDIKQISFIPEENSVILKYAIVELE